MCACMPDHIWMHEVYHMEKAICLLEMWRDIWSQIALKSMQGFIKERSYLTAQSVTRHFKAFRPFATFDAGECFFSFVNPYVYLKSICGCMPVHIWMHEMNHMEKAICLLKMWRDISSQIALKCTQEFIKERSYLTAKCDKAFQSFQTFCHIWCREMTFPLCESLCVF